VLKRPAEGPPNMRAGLALVRWGIRIFTEAITTPCRRRTWPLGASPTVPSPSAIRTAVRVNSSGHRRELHARWPSLRTKPDGAEARWDTRQPVAVKRLNNAVLKGCSSKPQSTLRAGAGVAWSSAWPPRARGWPAVPCVAAFGVSQTAKLGQRLLREAPSLLSACCLRGLALSGKGADPFPPRALSHRR